MNPEYDPENNSIPGKPSILLRKKPWGRTCIYVDAIDMHYIGTYVHSICMLWFSQIYIIFYVFSPFPCQWRIRPFYFPCFCHFLIENSRLQDPLFPPPFPAENFHSIRFHRLLWKFIVINVHYHLHVRIVYYATFWKSKFSVLLFT